MKLAQLRNGMIRASEEEIARSLEGNWREDILFELEQVLEAYDFQQKQIAGRDERLKKYIGEQPSREWGGGLGSAGGEGVAESKKRGRKKKAQPMPLKNQPAFDLSGELRRVMGVELTKIDGVKVMTVQTIYAEIGADFSAFRTEKHFAHGSCWLPGGM